MLRPMARFLVKTEPSTYSFADLVRDQRTVWDGVSNPVACKHLATIQKGDTVIVYHTGDEKQAVGLAVAASDAYPDPKLGNPKRPVVDLKPERPLEKPVTIYHACPHGVRDELRRLVSPGAFVNTTTQQLCEKFVRSLETWIRRLSGR